MGLNNSHTFDSKLKYMLLCISWSVLLSGFIPQLITAAILIIGYIWQFRSFRTQIQTQNEIAGRTSSVTVILKLEDQFEKLSGARSAVAKRILDSKLLDADAITNYQTQIGYEIEDVYDFFDTLGFLVIKHYLASDVAWNYFDHWFVSYYMLFKKYDIRKVAGYESTVWNNMTELKLIFDNIETENNSAIPRKEITNAGLKKFFSEELISD